MINLTITADEASSVMFALISQHESMLKMKDQAVEDAKENLGYGCLSVAQLSIDTAKRCDKEARKLKRLIDIVSSELNLN